MTVFLRRVAPLAGLAFAALFLAAFLVSGNSPGTGATGQHVIDWYTKHHDQQRVAAFLLAYAALLALIFGGSLRSYLRARSDSRAAINVASAGFVLLAAGLGVFSSLSFSLTDDTRKYEPAAAQALNVLDEDFFVILLVGLASLLLATGFVIVVSAALPRWLGWVTLVVAVVAMTPVGFFALLAFIVWSVVVSVLLFIRERKQPSASVAVATPQLAPAG